MTPPDTYHGNKLPVGYKLHNYRILGVLGEGGFGITYLAEDDMLHQKVAIKEYFPATLASRDSTTAKLHTAGGDAGKYFKWGLDRFISEARIMARIDHPNIVRVFNFATLNETGYMVMPYETGQPLDKWVGQFKDQKVPPATVVELLEPITRALGVIHGMSLIHRDVKPANIFIRESGSPVLLDFGAARSTVSAASQTVAAIVSTGYSPIEQYSDLSEQGPWTDIYATAAVAYRLITGKVPPDAPSRISAQAGGQSDRCEPLAAMKLTGYPPGFLAAIDKGLQVRPDMRPQSIEGWREMLGFQPVRDVRECEHVSTPRPSVARATSDRPAATGGQPYAMGAALAAVALGVIGIGTYLAIEQPWSAKTDIAEQADSQTSASVPDQTKLAVVSPVASEAERRTSADEDESDGSASEAKAPPPEETRDEPVVDKPEEEQAMLEEPPAASTSPEPSTDDAAADQDRRAQGLEQILSGSLLWTVLKMEFPDWYSERLKMAAAADDLQPTRRAVTQRYLPDLKKLRKSEAENALLAPSEFKQIAAIYLWNLNILKEHSVAACHDGIHRGEDSPFLSMLLDHQGAPFETLYGMMLRAAAVGQKLPNDVGSARQSDYNKLIKVLRSFGWKQKDLELFSDSAKLSQASPEKTCKLVTEWFQAHLAIQDEATQSRLLKETLRPLLVE